VILAPPGRKCPQRKDVLGQHTKLYARFQLYHPPFLSCCVVSMAKIIAVLRNPTERAFRHHSNFYQSYKLCTRMYTFDEWVDMEICTLTDADVVNASKDPYEEHLD
jgi:hypothetical protein